MQKVGHRTKAPTACGVYIESLGLFFCVCIYICIHLPTLCVCGPDVNKAESPGAHPNVPNFPPVLARATPKMKLVSR